MTDHHALNRLAAAAAAFTPRRPPLYHGCWAGQAEAISRFGLLPNEGYVHLSATPGMAWAYGAWATGLVMAEGITVDTIPSDLQTGRVGGTAADAMRNGGPNLAAVCTVELPASDNDVEEILQTAAPALPWEHEARAAPQYRVTGRIGPEWITGWQLYRVPELLEPGVLDRMTGRAEQLAHDYPRGRLVEDLSPEPVSPAIPNGRRLVAAILEHAGPAAELGHHGPAHWTRVAAHGLDVHPDADLTVVLLFALLHDAQRRHDGRDDGHGQRAADLARRLNGTVFTLGPDRLDALACACARHADGQVSDDPTVGACWDADRLDIGRYGKRLMPALMSTDRGRELAGPLPEPLNVRLPDVLAEYTTRLQLKDVPA